MADLTALKAANARRWANARLKRDFTAIARRLIEPAAKIKYQAVAKKTGVPWWFIAVVHEREASQRWDTQLGQGDPLHQISSHVPTGRGPFAAWEDGAYDALVNCHPFAARNKDWSAGGSLTMLEEYNGLGYANRGFPSPYVWSGTDQYSSGKYVRDGVFDPQIVDQQLGCAGLLLTMSTRDPTVKFSDGTVVSANPAQLPSEPSITNPAPGSIGAFIASIFTRLFGKKK